jgi:multidrug resistance protein, MATE family
MTQLILTTGRNRLPTALAGPLPGRRRRARLLAHELRELVRLAVPIIVSQLGGIAISVTDTIMVAPLGPRALAAAGLANAVQITVMMICTGTVMGMGPLVSQAYGAGERTECRRWLVQGVWLAALLAILPTAVCLAGRPIALLLGQEADVAQTAGAYLVSLAPGMLAAVVFAAFRQYLDSMGITRVAMVITFLGVIVNAVGNQLLIHGVEGVVPPLGVVGSGVATTIVRWTMLAVMVVYVARRADVTPFGQVSLRPAVAYLRRIVGVGAPVGAQYGAEVGIFALAAVMMGWLGPEQMAAHQVVINLASATFMVAVGVSLAGSIRVGHHVGAGSPRSVHRAVAGTYLLALAFMGLCAIVFLTIPEALIGLYTRDPAIVRFGTGLLFVAALFQLFDGMQVAGLALLRGAADTRVPMLVAILGYWVVGLPVAYLLGFRTPLEHVGIWTGLSVSPGVVGILLAWRVRRVLWGRPIARVAPAGALAPAGAALAAAE